ncbi:MAG: cysteine desulfurase [Clostridiales bacterium]|nr:cysteine desulfurase [Clostridiales bacterium]
MFSLKSENTNNPLAIKDASYLDNAATTAPCPEALAAMAEALQFNWGNPSSPHEHGYRAERLLEESRQTIASALNCKSEELYFTSGGTESNNIAVFGAARALKRRGKRIVVSGIEHSSVGDAAKALQEEGFELLVLEPDSSGIIPLNRLEEAIDAKTVLVSLMTANNETGAIQPIEKVRALVEAAQAPALIHTDAVQTFGKMRLSPQKLGVDLMSVSAHKLHGPKGVGALYVKKGLKLPSLFFGGSQEGRLRPGTQPLPAIAGFAAAVKALPDPESEAARQATLRARLTESLVELDGLHINSPENALPGLINFSLIGYFSDHIINHLSGLKVYISGGSACAKGEKSKVLAQMGLSQELIKSAVRVSFSRFTQNRDIDNLLEGLKSVKENLLKY